MSASEAQVLTDQWPFARHFVHSGMVAWQGHKMSKSRGNLVFVSVLRRSGVDPNAIRLALLSHHYRTDWAWTEHGLEGAAFRLDNWRSAVDSPVGPSAEPILQRVREALANDLRTPEALDAIDDWVRAQQSGEGDDPSAPDLIRRTADALLGIRI
jgi:L-cysteine:1D-myo-inositol 2-amino-2-deoxy-alpha-D-glucopyranoside ligase